MTLSKTARLVGASLFLLLPLSTTSETNNPILRRQTLQQDLCASVNTGSGDPLIDRYQSNGLCQDHCIEKDFAFAIVQYQSCWCSNVEPGKSSLGSVDEDCAAQCPGYPSESCGSRPGWYGYMRLVRQPTSTLAESTSSSRSSTTTMTTATSEATSPSASPTVSSTTSPATSPTTDETETVQSSATSSETPGPSASGVETITTGGTVRTVFVTPSSTADSDAADSDESSDGGSGLGTGAVVGIVIGVIGGVILLAAVGIFLYLRRRKQQKGDPGINNDKYEDHGGGSSAATPRLPNLVVTMGGPSSNADAGAEQRRSSRLMAVDPRMDPYAAPMYRNKSRESINTLHDDHDYSRKVTRPVLRATNPDPIDED
ncbi:hypothetical protein ACRALDRAFT_2043288 [Sodiomyces alcalophilus JCM 7366]|uniref:uncharacterized protein n=1 Tax=Sodiomyces alcalophilus JCM 7366 TaxID=591952 RepID=UPI0039B44783